MQTMEQNSAVWISRGNSASAGAGHPINLAAVHNKNAKESSQKWFILHHE
jgi:hypothetical protein